MSVLVAGGGMRTGQVVGSTNTKGEHPKDRPLTPNDLWATVYRHLGIDYEAALPNFNGRPVPILPYGADHRAAVMRFDRFRSPRWAPLLLRLPRAV